MPPDNRGPKSALGDNAVPFGEDHVIFAAERVGKAANKIEQAIAARRNMGAVLNVAVLEREGFVLLVTRWSCCSPWRRAQAAALFRQEERGVSDEATPEAALTWTPAALL